jgi:hypothetical protein
MTIRASKPAAWILAAGLLACMGAPSFATEASPWPATAGVTASDGQQAAPNAADQAGAADTNAAAQPDAVASGATDPNATQVSATNEDGAGWDKASIVGKIFIAAGTLLTLGSAARMFMI